MKLPQPFYKLAVRFDAQRLREEVAALPAEAWVHHPEKYKGNSSVRLISRDGGDNDEVGGHMRPTARLTACPYVQQVLASFGVVWSRSRLMKLGPRSEVPEHADINYHWFTRVRLHVPVITYPEVRFTCGGTSVHMAAGEAWIFDNWRRHRVENPTPHERVHLVADTCGTAAFWQWVMESQRSTEPARELRFRPDQAPQLMTERDVTPVVMPPSELELLVRDLGVDLVAPAQTEAALRALTQFRRLLESFCHDWRALWALHGESMAGWRDYLRLRDGLRERANQIGVPLAMSSNKVPALQVLEGRVLRHVLNLPDANVGASVPARREPGAQPEAVEGRDPASPPPAAPDPLPPSRVTTRFDRPLIIVAAPRSGSTLLFETLACSPQLASVGGEAHWMVEGIPELRPGAGGVESNRLLAEQCTPELSARIRDRVAAELKDSAGRPWTRQSARFLEKTPKNALRVPFLERLFPDARYVFLWRDPRASLSSMMEAWRSGGWITYPQLDGWDGPWSLLLPPGWQALRGKPLEEVCAYQWDCTNRIVMDDLALLPRERWMSLSYETLLAEPRLAVRRVCDLAHLDFDAALRERAGAPLPLSRYTQTPPDPEKWRRNETEIERVLPGLQATLERLQTL